MDIALLLTMLMEFLGPILEDCFDPDDVEKVRSFGVGMRAQVIRAAKQDGRDQGMSRKERRAYALKTVETTKAAIDAATDDEIRDATAVLRRPPIF